MAYTSILQKLSENLKTTYENTIFTHSGNVGDTREKEVISFLRKVMSRQYGFQSGEVFDEEDKNSGQVDVIIYDDLFSTIFTDGTDKVMAPVESTYGVISVKSKMGTGELDDAIRGIKKYNDLKRPETPENTSYITPDLSIAGGSGITFGKSHQQNVNCIFAFDTTVATNTILEKVKEAGIIDLLVVPGKLCVIGRKRNEFSLQKDGNILSNYIILTEKSVSVFVVILQLYLRRNRLIARDIEKLALWLVHQSNLLL